MGNLASSLVTSDVETSPLSLDALGGWHRPAIKRGDSLNKKLEWLHNSVRKQADLMEHELLKIPVEPHSPDRTSSSSAQEASKVTRGTHMIKPDWDGTFWGHANRKREENTAETVRRVSSFADFGQVLDGDQQFSQQSSKVVMRNAVHEKQYDRPWRRSDGLQKRSWPQKLRDKLQTRLKKLREENIEDMLNNDNQCLSGSQQMPLWRLNVARAKIKILIYLQALIADMRENKEHALVLREQSLPAYAMVALGSSFEGFCQQQVLHSQVSLELSNRKTISNLSQSRSLSDKNEIQEGKSCSLHETNSHSNTDLNDLNVLNSFCQSKDGLSVQCRKEKASRLMQMHVNRANAKWVEEKKWSDPFVYDPAALVLGRVDIRIYKHLVVEMISEGKIAIQLIDNNIKVEVVQEDGVKTLCPVLSFDLWEKVISDFPWKVPAQGRLEGLSVISRRLLQIVVDVRRKAGSDAVSKLKVILCVDVNQEAYIKHLLIDHKFFGLQRENVVIMAVPQFQGIQYDKYDAGMKWCTESAWHSAGSGWSILTLKSPKSKAYRLDIETNEPSLLEITPLEWLREREVSWINVQSIMDWERLSGDSSINLDFCAASLYCSDEKGSNMLMEVLESESSKEIWNGMSLVLGEEENPRNCCHINTTDLQTPLTRKLIMDAERRGSLVTCQHRYMFKAKALSEMTIAPCTMRPSLSIDGENLYLNFHLSNITAIPTSRCAAVLTTSAGPQSRIEVLQRDWFHTAASGLMKQDSDPDFLAAALASCTRKSSVVLRSVSEGFCREVIVVFVTENLVCKRTASVASFFARETTDDLHLVTCVKGEQHIQKADSFLDSISKSLFPHHSNIHCKVLTRTQGRVIDTMEEYLHRVKARLVVLGSENLAKESSEIIGSFAMTVVKTINYLPVLIVKVNSMGECHRHQANDQTRISKYALRCMIEVRPNAYGVVEWTLEKLNCKRDVLYLAKPRGIDQTDVETPVATRMLMTFRDKVDSFGYTSVPRPLKGEPVKSLCEVRKSSPDRENSENCEVEYPDI